jgi:hypothetical protein
VLDINARIRLFRRQSQERCAALTVRRHAKRSLRRRVKARRALARLRKQAERVDVDPKVWG